MSTKDNNIIRFPGEDIADVEVDAARWLARVTSGSMTVSDLAEFALWRAASRDRDRVYGELEAMWNGLAPIASSGQSHRDDALTAPGSRRWGWAMRLTQIAAAVAIVVGASQYLSVWRYDFHTVAGETRQVALADGSKVYLSGNTAINVRVSRTGARSVELARGEAFFEVRHDASRPFTVSVGNGEIRDVGTAFSIAREGASAQVAVAEGIVAVKAAGRSDMLFKGQQLSFDPYSMSAKALVDVSAISAWRRGIYVAENKSLGTVLKDLDAHYARKIVMLDSGLARRRVNAVVQLDHIDDWLDALGDTKGVSIRRLGPFTIVAAR